MCSAGRSILLLLIAFGAAGATSAQTLEGMRSEVREKKERPSRAADSKRQSSCDDEEDSGWVVQALAEQPIVQNLAGVAAMGAVVGVTSPIWAPQKVLDDEGGPGYFPKYPYGKHGGSLLFDESRRGAHSSLLVLQGDYGSDFDSLSQAHVRFFGERDHRFGFDTEFFYREEELRPGTDDLWHGDFNLTYRFAQNEHWQFRAGVGVNWLTDDLDTDFGFNATYGVEWFPVKPWVLNSSLDWGRIGSTSLLHLRNTVGVTRSGWGVFTGHDYLRIGDDRINSFIVGLEYRF
ncbi:MAG: hypothetical protein AB8G99_10680 [Planctomycetaceae bacterium]